jgi:hypothetical protein
MNYSSINRDAERAEEMIPSMTYATLVNNLGRLTQLGVVAPGNPVSMLVVARIVDRSRILRSGMGAEELRRALAVYCNATQWKPVYAVVKALEQAVETAVSLENKTQPAPYSAW